MPQIVSVRRPEPLPTKFIQMMKYDEATVRRVESRINSLYDQVESELRQGFFKPGPGLQVNGSQVTVQDLITIAMNPMEGLSLGSIRSEFGGPNPYQVPLKFS